MRNEKYTPWDAKGTEAKKLLEQLDLYVTTDGAAGINPDIHKPAVILSEIYNKYDYLKVLNPQYFPDRYRKLKTKWLTAQACNRARVQEKNKQG